MTFVIQVHLLKVFEMRMKCFAAVSLLTLLNEVFCAPISNQNDIKVVSQYDNRHANEYDFGYVNPKNFKEL